MRIIHDIIGSFRILQTFGANSKLNTVEFRFSWVSKEINYLYQLLQLSHHYVLVVMPVVIVMYPKKEKCVPIKDMTFVSWGGKLGWCTF